MGSHPLNLAVRFGLEVAALVALGVWGWHQGDGVLRWCLALALPAIAATIWGTFAVPQDPSRSGHALAAVPGRLRLAIELVFFAAALVALYSVGAATISWVLGILILIHYAVSYDRVRWLINH